MILVPLCSRSWRRVKSSNGNSSLELQYRLIPLETTADNDETLTFLRKTFSFELWKPKKYEKSDDDDDRKIFHYTQSHTSPIANQAEHYVGS